MRSLVLAVLLVACGSRSGSAPLPPTTGVVLAALPVAPPMARPGERMTYRLSVQGVELGTFDILVSKPAEVAGKQAIVVQSHARSTGLAKMVAKVDDRFTSWLDPQTGRSLRFQADEYATNSTTELEHTVADIAARTGDEIPVHYHRNEDPPTPEPQRITVADVWDTNAFLIALRGWEGPPGTRVIAHVFRSRWLWRIEVTIRGRETLVTELGELPALRFDAVTYKLDRKGQRVTTHPERSFSVWISDDGDRVPLQNVAKTDYGDIKMEIVDYQPGA